MSNSIYILNIHSSNESFLTAYEQFLTYVAKLSMNSTVNGSIESCFEAQLNSNALKIGGTVTLCVIFIVSLAGDSPIVIVHLSLPECSEA